jgi:hypothetical protein
MSDIIYKVCGFKCVEKITHYKGVKETNKNTSSGASPVHKKCLLNGV